MSSKNGSGAARKQKRITVEVKKEIIMKHENGVRVCDIANEYSMAKSTISTIIKNKELLKSVDVAKGVTKLQKQRPQILEKVENLLLIWINEKQLAGDSVSAAIICEKAKLLHSDLLSKLLGTSAETDDFKASRGWFEKFKKRSGIHSVIRHGEAASSNEKEAEAFKVEFDKIIKEEDYVPQQVFNCDETGLFWKKMPKRTFITQEEKALPGHKPMKDRLTLLFCANASGDCKIMPMLVYHSENPRVFKHNKVQKSKLPVMWKSNAKAWMTRAIFMEWLTKVFAPSVKKYLEENNLPLRCLLLMDNAPAHPPGLEEDLDMEYDFIKVKFLPPNTTPLLQPMDQQVISNFKKLYTKELFSRCFQVTNDTELTLRDYWKDHFNILHCINLIDKAWNDVSTRTLKSAWKKVWPSCVPEREEFEGLEADAAAVVDEIVSLGKNMGLEVDGNDLEELIEDHSGELTTDELVDRQNEQLKTLKEEQSSDDEEPVTVSTARIKEICSKWADVEDFIVNHHPNKLVANRAVNLMNDNAMAHFRKILQQRKRQISLDSFLVQKDSQLAAKKQRQETPETNDS